MRKYSSKSELCKKAPSVLLLFGCLAAALPARAASTTDAVMISDTLLPTAGKFVAGSGTSSFLVDASTGSISRQSGTATRLTSGSTITTPIITITCNKSLASGTACLKGTVMTVTIASTGSGSASLSSFNIGATSGTSVVWGTPTSSNGQLTFTVTFNDAKYTTASFQLGYTVLVPAAGSSTGTFSLPYTVTINRP